MLKHLLSIHCVPGAGDTKVIKTHSWSRRKDGSIKYNHFSLVSLVNSSMYTWKGDEWLIHLWEKEDKSGLHRKS